MTRHCWDLNPNFWMTTEPGSPRNSVLPWAHIQCPFDPGRGTVTSHLPGPRNALQSPQRAPSGTSPPPVAAVHVPAPRRPRCPLCHRKPGQPSGPTPVMQSEIPPQISTLLMRGRVVWRVRCHHSALGGLDPFLILPEGSAPFLA